MELFFILDLETGSLKFLLWDVTISEDCYYTLQALIKSPRIKLESSAFLTRQFGVFRLIFFSPFTSFVNPYLWFKSFKWLQKHNGSRTEQSFANCHVWWGMIQNETFCWHLAWSLSRINKNVHFSVVKNSVYFCMSGQLRWGWVLVGMGEWVAGRDTLKGQLKGSLSLDLILFGSIKMK